MHEVQSGIYPVAAYQDVSAFKLYYSDMGIMSARIGMTLEALQSMETEHFRGILTENYVAIALKTMVMIFIIGSLIIRRKWIS